MGTQAQKPLRGNCCFSTTLFFLACIAIGPILASEETAPRKAGISYRHDKIAEHPWSVHVLKIDLSRKDYQFQTTLAKGTMQGLSTLSEQLRSWPTNGGEPLAAINGDFWKDGRNYEGDPKGLHILQGELVSGPADRPAFWIDTNGLPQTTNVMSHLRATWPGGQSILFGLNEERAEDGAVLYTSRFGATTRTRGGREFILAKAAEGAWLPLKPNVTYHVRVAEVREGGNAPVPPQSMVLSLGPAAVTQMPALDAGSTLRLSTGMIPDLTGVTTAIGGGPVLVRNSKAVQFSGSQPRHPRTAIGWNGNHFFFMQVDGRQPGISVGMSFPELANYMSKLGCTEALNLDGGGSATFWLFGQVMNSPCFGTERPMANALLLVQKQTTQTNKNGAVSSP